MEIAKEMKRNTKDGLLDPGNLLFLLYIALMVIFVLVGTLANSQAAVTEVTKGVQQEMIYQGDTQI